MLHNVAKKTYLLLIVQVQENIFKNLLSEEKSLKQFHIELIG